MELLCEKRYLGVCFLFLEYFLGDRTSRVPGAFQTPPEPVFGREERPHGGRPKIRVRIEHVQIEGLQAHNSLIPRKTRLDHSFES